MISRRHLLISSLGAALAAPSPALAQAWPARPITVIVPFAAGGTTDIIARVVGDLLGQKLGQTFIVENRGGAGGAIGSDAVVRAAPDGYTLLHATAGTLTYNPHIIQKPGQGPQNPLAVLTPIGLTFACDFVVIVRKGFPAETLQDFIAHAKAKPDDVTFGSGGLGSGAHVCTELFMARTGTRMRHVTYRGSGPALNDLAAGQIDVIFDAMPSALGQIQGGTVKILATTGPQRSAILPAVPTVMESGLKDYVVTAWGGLLGPKGTSPEVVRTVSGGLAEILTRKDVMDRFLQIGAEAITETTEQMTSRIEAEFSLWGKIMMRRKSARNNCARIVNDKRVARAWRREALANTSRPASIDRIFTRDPLRMLPAAHNRFTCRADPTLGTKVLLPRPRYAGMREEGWE